MSHFSTTYDVGGVAYWSGFSDANSSAPIRGFESNRPGFRPGRPKPVSGFFASRTGISDEAIASIDFLKSENSKDHHTDKCGLENLLVRRGQDFKLRIDLKVPYDKKDRLQIIFSKGKQPLESKGSLIRVDLFQDIEAAQKAKRQFDWLGYITSISSTEWNAVADCFETKIYVTIKSNSDALVGRYDVQTTIYKTDLDGKRKPYVSKEKLQLYVLFNAWNKDDQVYLADEAEREEYVLNETGKIWRGSTFWNSPSSWNFGQFSKSCMKAAMYLLEISDLKDPAHGNPTLVSRTMSAMANSCDYDRGVLTGNWSGNYEGGTPPTKWTGSVKILEEYMDTKRSVEYGQCWVFSGLLTTLCRSLGIPTRTVTNFDSAHDNDASMTIDTCVDEEGNSLNGMNDSVWNFHVWNESWFRRPDLPAGYDGWQAFDATPQEASEGIMRCGPAPVKAIKEGNVYLKYDAKFIFGEVNGDRVTWIVDKEGCRKPLKEKTKTSAVGHIISTKQVGSNERNDVTGHYKAKEGSKEERAAVERACSFGSRKANLGDLYNAAPEDLAIDWTYEVVEGDILIKLKIENTGKELRTAFVRATANATYYTGAVGEKLGDTRGVLRLNPGQKSENSLVLSAASYLNQIDADAKIKILVFTKVTETNQYFYKDHVIEVEKPDIIVKVSNPEPKVGEQISVEITVKNPVKVDLTNPVLSVEGPGITRVQDYHLGDVIEAGKEVTKTIKLTTKYPGKRELICGFTCRQLSSMSGSAFVHVQ